jgi:hypothetical protein
MQDGPGIGEAWTNESMEDIRQEYIARAANMSSNASKKLQGELHGFCQLRPLITQYDHIIVPGLHIKLGITVDLLDDLIAWVTKEVESFELVVLNLMNERDAAQEKLDEKKQFIQDMEEEIKKVKAVVDERHKLRQPLQKRIAAIRKYKTPTMIQGAQHELLHLLDQLTLLPPLESEVLHLERCKEEQTHKRTEKERAQSALDLATTTLKGEMDARNYRPVEGAIEDILADIGVVRQAHHGGTLQGNACQLLLVHHTDVLNRIGAAMKDPDLRRDVNNKEEFDNKIDMYIKERIKIMDSLDVIVSQMSRQHNIATDMECDRMDDLCKQFASLWRDKI